MIVNEVQFQNLFEMYKLEMHCQVILVVVEKTVWKQHEFDDLEPLCVIPPDLDPHLPHPTGPEP